MTLMLTRLEMEQKLAPAFAPPQLTSLLEVLDVLREVEIERAADTRDLKQGLAALTQEVKKLTVAQRQTDQRVGELAVAHKSLAEQVVESARRTDERFAAMAETQQQLIAGMAELRATVGELAANQLEFTRGLADLRVAVGGLANTFGFNLEEFVAALLPSYLERYKGITDLVLERRYFELDDRRYEEVDLAGEGWRDGHGVTVLVECRAKVGGGEVRRLADKLTTVAQSLDEGETLLVIVAMNIHPTAEPVAAASGIWLVPYSRINRDRG